MRRPGHRLIPDDTPIKGAPVKRRRPEAVRKPKISEGPTPLGTPAENLELLHAMNPRMYRTTCGLVQFAVEREWHEMTIPEREDALTELQRRRQAASALASMKVGKF